MVVRRQKRSRRQRGKSTHGWGFTKRHRGKGHKGSSGVGKRGAHRESYYHALGFEPIGKHGILFKPRVVKVPEAIMSLEDLERLSGSKNEVDIIKLGNVKLLGKGKITKKLKVVCK